MRVVCARIAAFFVTASVVCSTAFARAPLEKGPLEKPAPAKVAAERLARVRDRVSTLSQAGHRPVVVFDIDKTLVTAPPGGGKPSLSVHARPGAVHYVKSLERAGATIVYLTGRRQEQRDITVDMFHEVGLPLGRHEHLLLDPSKTYDKRQILAWKASARPLILKLGQPVAVFDDDMREVRMFSKQYPGSDVFRVQAPSKVKDPGGKGPVTVIKHF